MGTSVERIAAHPGRRWLSVTVRSPDTQQLLLVVRSHQTGVERVELMTRRGEYWSGATEVVAGERYWLTADGVGPLVDPSAWQVEFENGRPWSIVPSHEWPAGRQLGRHHRHPVVYELHVRGFAQTFRGVIDRLGYLADLGVQAIELMPINPFDTSNNYWGYMPVVWGAVHSPYAEGDDAAAELASLVAAAHDHGIEVWLDVVFNHTGEGSADLPTWSLRGLDDRHAYRHLPDGRYADDSGCGNDTDPADPGVRELVLEALERFAALGVDGFRFDLASLLTRDGGELVDHIGDWAAQCGVRLVAEPWDLGAYQVGREFPDDRWAQWNDRFRDDVRGFLRSEPGLVPSMAHRVSGSPDLFEESIWRSVNFVTAHDGLTLHDLTAVTSERHRSWDCGHQLRLQQMTNAFTLLLLSSGAAMFVMGDEFARTQHGHDNPYDIDDELSWVDWARLEEWRDLHHLVRRLIALRHRADFDRVTCFGAHGWPDHAHDSRSLAWSTGELYVMVNTWWEPLEFFVQAPGRWSLVVASSATTAPQRDGESVVVAPRSVAVLVRDEAGEVKGAT